MVSTAVIEIENNADLLVIDIINLQAGLVHRALMGCRVPPTD
jgi:hypothetical protein